jgi:hypothetical protein
MIVGRNNRFLYLTGIEEDRQLEIDLCTRVATRACLTFQTDMHPVYSPIRISNHSPSTKINFFSRDVQRALGGGSQFDMTGRVDHMPYPASQDAILDVLRKNDT